MRGCGWGECLCPYMVTSFSSCTRPNMGDALSAILNVSIAFIIYLHMACISYTLTYTCFYSITVCSHQYRSQDMPAKHLLD